MKNAHRPRKKRTNRQFIYTQNSIYTYPICIWPKTTPTTGIHTEKMYRNKKRIVVNGDVPPLVKPSDASDIFQMAPATGHYGCITAAAELQDAAAHFS